MSLQNQIKTYCLLILITIFSLPSNSIAQEIMKRYEGQSYQTVIYSVTNREFTVLNDSTFILGAKIDTLNELKYFRAYFDGQFWSYEQFHSLNELMGDENEYQDYLFFVHGLGRTYQGAIDNSYEIWKLYDINVIVFSWPSLDPDASVFKNFKIAMQNIEDGQSDFIEVISELNTFRKENFERFENQKLSLFCHSMANSYLELYGKLDDSIKLNEKIFDNLIINSAAVGAEGHNGWVEKMDIQSRIYINSNGGDLNLAGLNMFTRLGMQLGEAPLAPLADNANYINFTDAVGVKLPPGPSHSYYYSKITEESENIRNFYNTLFHGREIDFQNGLFVRNDEYPGYSISF